MQHPNFHHPYATWDSIYITGWQIVFYTEGKYVLRNLSHFTIWWFDYLIIFWVSHASKVMLKILQARL